MAKAGTDRYFKVFVSSTYSDLIEERRHVSEGLLEADCIPAGMELFPAAPGKPLEYIYKVIDTCDFYLLVLAGRYGSMSPAGMSFTEAEYNYAVERKKPVIAFVRDHASIPKRTGLREKRGSTAFARLEAFRDRVKRPDMIRHWSSGHELKAAVIQACKDLGESSDGGYVRSPSCPYLRRFANTQETPLLLTAGEQTTDGERAYRLLRYMFANEKFNRFRALDLAMDRWGEVLDKETQTVNVSRGIIADIETLLKEKRCLDFQRILVAPARQFTSARGREIRAFLRKKEETWRSKYGASVETRLLLYPEVNVPGPEDDELRKGIKSLHDFALFIRGDDPAPTPHNDLAIIETTLVKPTERQSAELGDFKLQSDAAQTSEMAKRFAILWNETVAIGHAVSSRPARPTDKKGRRRKAPGVKRKGVR